MTPQSIPPAITELPAFNNLSQNARELLALFLDCLFPLCHEGRARLAPLQEERRLSDAELWSYAMGAAAELVTQGFIRSASGFMDKKEIVATIPHEIVNLAVS